MSPSHKDAPGKGSSQGFSSSSSGQPRSVCSIPGKRRRRSPNVSCLLSMTEAALRQIAGCSVQFLCLVNVGHSARVIQSLVVRQPAKDALMDGADFQGGGGAFALRPNSLWCVLLIVGIVSRLSPPDST